MPHVRTRRGVHMAAHRDVHFAFDGLTLDMEDKARLEDVIRRAWEDVGLVVREVLNKHAEDEKACQHLTIERGGRLGDRAGKHFDTHVVFTVDIC